MKIAVSIQPIEVQDEDGNTVFKTGILDLYYLMGDTIAKIPQQERNDAGMYDLPTNEWRFMHVAAAINARHKCNITWGVASQIMQELDKAVAELKKNGKLTPTTKPEESTSDTTSKEQPSP